MLRLLLIWACIGLASARITFLSPTSNHEIRIDPTFENGTYIQYPYFGYPDMTRRITTRCVLSPDDIPCHYIPTTFRCDHRTCQGITPKNTQLLRVQIESKIVPTQMTNPKSWSHERIDTMEDIHIDYVLRTCVGCPTCDDISWSIYYSAATGVGVFTGLLILMTILDKSPDSSRRVVYMTMAILAVMVGIGSHFMNACHQSAPLN